MYDMLHFKSLQLLLLLMFATMSLRSQTSPFRIVGYVPNWIEVEAFAQSFNFKQLTHINYAFQNPDVAGNLVSSNSGLTTLVAKSHANNVKVLVSIGGGLAADGPVKDNFQNLNQTVDSLHVSSVHRKEKMRIRITALNPGSYVCRVTSSEGIYSKQFLKE